MKVLMICTEKLPVPPIRGGAIQTYIEGVSSSLSKQYELTILGKDDPDLPNEEKIRNISYVRIPGGLFEIYERGVIEYLKENTFDIIHIFNRPRLVKSVRAVAPMSRLVLSMHNDMFKPEKIDQEEATIAIEQLDKIITVSDYIGQTIAEPFPQAKPKLKTIYSGVDIDRFAHPHSEQARKMRNKIRQEHNLQNKKVILFTGRLSANKGADILVKAMPKLAKKHPDAALVIVGSKWFSQNDVTDYVAYVRALADRLPIPVITTGFVSPDEIQNWFAAADIFVCPSQWQEPLARVHYEAMASGRPIVTTARGGNPEVIVENENGIVIKNPEDPQEFADRLSYLLSSPTLAKKMGEYGRSLAESKYTWKRVADDILSVWNEIEYKIKNNLTVTSEEVKEETVFAEVLNEPSVEDVVLGTEEAMETDDIFIPDVETVEEEVLITEVVSERVVEDTSDDKVEEAKVTRPLTKKEKIRAILFNELTKSNPFMESLLADAEDKVEDDNENELQQTVKSMLEGIEKQLLAKREEEAKPKEEPRHVVETVNDIATAKLFSNVKQFSRSRKKRRKNA
ncbi:glycosyltransferase family 4 protein [Alkalihalobacterium alkalinitrilicum]|uniref:glycosyltransferase family 4 protein n=1 Tax=Alkalihalobacterium alkalinitrilicum TaxID=427920 RepID=UPI00099498FE|nr:glycosyltransferase family 4 protein [Alkalihalobacterium alkalinitrilicum]